MKKTLLFSLACIITMSLIGQTTFPNMSFEDWEDGSSSGRWQQPTGGVWAVPNEPVDINPFNDQDEPTKKTTDAHEGSFAAEMKTIEIFGQLAAGTLFTGTFDLNLSDPVESAKFGQPFTGQPTSFKLWYKYEGVSGDSCEIYARLHKWNTTTNQREFVGEAYFKSTDIVSTYTQLDLPFVYTSSDMPDSASIVFTSSAGGEQFEGQVGSKLWVDALDIDYTPVGLNEISAKNATIFPNPAKENLNIRFEERQSNSIVTIYNINGQIVKEITVNDIAININIENLPSAYYLYNVKTQTGAITYSGSFIKE